MTTAGHARDGALSVLEALGRDASRVPFRGTRPALSPSDSAAWSAFGSAATDQQRINLVLRPALAGRDLFFNAGSVLDEDAFATAVGEAGLPPQAARPLSAAARAFLEAAEGVVDRHRTRLSLGPGSAPAVAREDCVVLDWKRIAGGRATAVEVVPVAAFTAGDWEGLQAAVLRAGTAAVLCGVHGAAGAAGTLRTGAPCLACLGAEQARSLGLYPEGGGATVAAAAGVIGVVAATEAVKLILGIGSPLTGRVLTYDGWTATFGEHGYERNPRCSACGS